MTKLNNQIKKAVQNSQKAQRNYDLSKSVSTTDIKTLIYAAQNSPSKQNETHYALYVYTDRDIIYEIYNHTKKHTLGMNEALEKGKGEEWLYENKSVRNSQIYANILFVYVDDEGSARGADHLKAKNGDESSKLVLDEQKNISIGISVGELILSAGLLGYKTGICSGLDRNPIKNIMKITSEPKLLVGVGYSNTDMDRRLHAETRNKDVPVDYRTGSPHELWKFPSYTKETTVYLNGKTYNNDN